MVYQGINDFIFCIIFSIINIEEVKMLTKQQKSLNLTSAFTLAEVLITLGIIGVVAAITIPTLVNNIQDQQWKTAYKKAYSTLSQALLSANTDGLLTVPCPNSNSCNNNNFNALKSY